MLRLMAWAGACGYLPLLAVFALPERLIGS
jgi:hypothetical protein